MPPNRTNSATMLIGLVNNIQMSHCEQKCELTNANSLLEFLVVGTAQIRRWNKAVWKFGDALWYYDHDMDEVADFLTQSWNIDDILAERTVNGASFWPVLWRPGAPWPAVVWGRDSWPVAACAAADAGTPSWSGSGSLRGMKWITRRACHTTSPSCLTFRLLVHCFVRFEYVAIS